MFHAYKDFWKRYVDFTGKSTRSEFWYVQLAHLLFYIGIVNISYIEEMIASNKYGEGASSGDLSVTLLMIYLTAAIIPQLAITVRRLRDGANSWIGIFFVLVPAIGGIILLVMLCGETVDFSKDDDFDDSDDQEGSENHPPQEKKYTSPMLDLDK